MLRIAAVSSDDDVRLALARAFDAAPASWTVTLHDDSPPPDVDVVVCGPDRALEDAIAFDPASPHDVLDAVKGRIASSTRRPVVVVGATGGCGATSVALHLGCASAGCVVDSAEGDVRRRLNMAAAKSWAPALDGESLDLCALPVAPGLRVLLAPDEAPSTQVATVVERALPAFDHVIVDAKEPWAGAGAIGVVVLTPTRPSAERGRAILSAHPSMRWAAVTNRLGPGSGLDRRALEDLLGRRLTVELPCSAGLRDAEDDGRLLTSALSPWVWQIKRLWRALETA